MMQTPRDPSRRSFLQASGAAAAGLSAFGAPALNVLGANETIRVGLIGTGGRCRKLMESLAKVPNTTMAAVCDIYDVHREMAREKADPKAFVTRHYPELLDRKDIDAVLIASPDHWHVPMTIDACAAGKDVYVEKPLTHSIEEGAAVLEARNKSGRVVQVGTQQRSMPHLQQAFEIVKSGRLGEIHKVHLTWNRNANRSKSFVSKVDPTQFDWKAFLGNAPDQPFDGYRAISNWRWFWDFGGGLLTDLMVHFLDVAHWYLGLDHPVKATTIGDNFSTRGVWQTPDTAQTLLVYPGGVQVYFEGTFSNARNGAMAEFMGTEATLYVDRGRYEVHPEYNKKGKNEELVLGDGRRGADFYDRPDGELLHLTDWIESIRGRRQPAAPVEAGVSAASAAHLGNQAFRTGTVATWEG